MIPKEENELLTQTGPGTLCGKLMRRYWQPAALAEELPQGGAPLPVRLLGEDLVLFRDDHGRPGLLGIHCSHRGADLSYGRVEDGGLRCIYHGWLYDIHGRCLDQPGEPGGGEHKGSIRHTAYPCEERGGIILAYMGPGEAPLLPNYEFFNVPEDHRTAHKLYSECNYLQGNEGNIDLIHNNFLHFVKRDLERLNPEEYQQVMERFGDPGTLTGRGPDPGMESTNAQLLDLGVRICKLRDMGEGRSYIRVATFVLPNFTVIPGGGVNWHVPIDDTHHWKYIIAFSREKAIGRGENQRSELAPAPTYRPVASKSNRYLQDREAMKTTLYCGIPPKYFAAQDLCAVEGAGIVQDRTKEHLVVTDAPIVMCRKVLQKAIQDVKEGRDPAHVVRDPKLNRFPEIVATYGVLPDSMDWKEYCNRLEAEGTGWHTKAAR